MARRVRWAGPLRKILECERQTRVLYLQCQLARYFGELTFSFRQLAMQHRHLIDRYVSGSAAPTSDAPLARGSHPTSRTARANPKAVRRWCHKTQPCTLSLVLNIVCFSRLPGRGG